MSVTRAAWRALIAALALVVGMAVVVPGTILAADQGDVTVELNGEVLALDPPAFLFEGRTFVPLRGLFERLGAEVAFDPATSQITVTRGQRSVLLTLGSREAVVDGHPRTTDEPPLLINDRAYVPARFVTEALGDRADWLAHRSTLAIGSAYAARLGDTAGEDQAEARKPVVPYTEQELDLLTRLINAEAYDEPYEGMVAVGAVVVNRVLDPEWPDTIYDVIMHPGQFTPVWNGHIDRPVRPEARLAALDALHGVDPSNGAIFFYNPRTARSQPGSVETAVIGNHVFRR
ncbi:MAG TPA: stalk domain-containing protein [Bacillota bacterium]